MQDYLKNLIKTLVLVQWKHFIDFVITVNIFFKKCMALINIFERNPRLFYGGAISGNYGGPRVKVSQLKEIFHQNLLNFNLVYVLSNYSYLSENSLRKIRKAQVPIVLNQNGVFTDGWYGKGWEKRNIPNLIAYEFCDYVFWQSEFAKLTSEKFLSDKSKLGEILYNAVNLERYYPKKKVNSSEFIFLVAGNFNSYSSYYQIEATLMALAVLKKDLHIKVRFAGLSSLMEKATVERAVSLNIHEQVEIFGRYSQQKWPESIREADAYIALKYQDTCPNLVLEAMASGLPVLYSSSGGTPELVNEHSGIGLEAKGDWSTKPFAPKTSEIADAMLVMIENIESMSQAARSRAEDKFDLRFWFKRHIEVFDSLLRK